MRKRLLALAMVVCLLVSPISVRADVIMGNDFRYQHKDEMQKLDRSRFVANGPEGFVLPQHEPGDPDTFEDPHENYRKNYTYRNGSVLLLDCTYVHEDEIWGVQSSGHHVGLPGWTPMSQLLAVYIPADFRAENKDSFYTYAGSLDILHRAKRLVLWQWPGADREKRVFESGDYTFQDIKVLDAYKDEAGREWGYIKFNYSYSNLTEAWVCLTDPSNSSSIPPFYPAPKPTEWVPDGALVWTHGDNGIVEPYVQHTLANLSKVRTYTPNEAFIDVPTNAWYNDAIATAYEYNMLNGKGNNIFDPRGSLRIGEALTMASRIHAYYKYGQTEGDRWLAVYDENNYFTHGTAYRWEGAYSYCHIENLVRGIDFRDYVDAVYQDEKYDYFWNYEGYSYTDYLELPITRAQMVHAWAKILQPGDMVKQNTVIALPDVDADTPYYEDIRLFYEAGILSGIDAAGTFNPEGNITRAEAATVFMNLIDVSRRGTGRTYGE